MLLYSEFLPVDENAFLINQLELRLVEALVVRTPVWLSVLELLLDIRSDLLALLASERAHQEFWLGVSGPGHGSVNRHKSAQHSGLQVPNFVDLSQVVKPNLIQFLLILSHLFAVIHKNGESLSQVGLIPVEFLQNLFWEILVLVLELLHVSEVDMHVIFIVLKHFLSLNAIIVNGLAFLHLAIFTNYIVCVLVIVRVFL